MEQLAEIPYAEPVFMFFSRSTHAAAGTGAEESIHPNDWGKYAALNTIIHWRRMLSNFFTREHPTTPLFVLDGRSWRSVEHFFHAMKFKTSHPEYYEQFALNSGSELSRSDGATAKKAGRLIKLTPEQINAWDNGGSRAVLMRSQEAKFRQNDDLKNVLLLTRGAVLKHKASRFTPLVVEQDLMNLRALLYAEEERAKKEHNAGR